MAIQKQLNILQQGVEVWNTWREQQLATSIDLSGADLSETDLTNVNFSNTDLSSADLYKANLYKANLSAADLSHGEFSFTNLTNANFTNAKLIYSHFIAADLISADLTNANLTMANLGGANLTMANLSGADFTMANLSEANLTNANLSEADLSYVNFSEADLTDANLSRATVGGTIFGSLDLRTIKGLETIHHDGPSTIGTNTLERSEGDIPDVFLREAGLSPIFIKYAHSLTQSSIQYYTCFISYSSRDQVFAERFRADLLSKGVNCWFARHDMHIGDKIRPRIDESIRQYDKLLLILSEHSIKSQWVEHEVETAIGKELEGIPNVLFPIRLDNTIMESKTGWASHIKLTRHIGDFTQWEYHPHYEKAFQRLLHDLQPDKQ